MNNKIETKRKEIETLLIQAAQFAEIDITPEDLKENGYITQAQYEIIQAWNAK